MPNRQQSDAVLISSCLSCAPGASGWRWVRPLSRRAVLGSAAGLALASVARRASAVQTVAPAFSYPMGIPGRTLGDGAGTNGSHFLQARRLAAPAGFADDELGGDKWRWSMKARFDFSEFAA